MINDTPDAAPSSSTVAATTTNDPPDTVLPVSADVPATGAATDPAANAALTAHDIQRIFAARGNHLFTRNGNIVVNNATTLTDYDRALLKQWKSELLVIVPLFPGETPKRSTIIQFIGEAPAQNAPSDWKLEAPPSLNGITEIELDFETDGVNWHEKDIMIGWAVRLPNGYKKYFPVRHRNSSVEQLPENVARDWFKQELKHVRITNAATRFEVHTARAFGVDLVEQGCTFSDVMHYAALLDDHRKRFALTVLSQDYLGREKAGMNLDPSRMADYEPWVVAQRAEGDVETVAELKAAMWPLLDAQGLQRVRALEDEVIPVVCEMEANGAPIDVELLHRWNKESQEHYFSLIREISHEAGFNFDDTDASWIRLFERYKIPLTFRRDKYTGQPTDKPTFKDSVLAPIEHPTIKKARFAAQLDSLRSKVYVPYSENVGADGILRVEFNQLRYADDKGDSGTISGRFSAAYVQQVPNHDNHFEVFGDLYDPRRLYIPGKETRDVGGLFLGGDAEQIEYRLFANHAKNPRVLAAYRDDPAMSFHRYMHPKITAYRPDFNYVSMKSFNFMKIYGGGLVKIAVMLGFITEEQGEDIRRMKAQRSSPLLTRAREIQEIYAREMPEADSLARKAMHLAMPECNKYCNRGDALHREFKHRGYVKTLLGRRQRFPTEYKIHKALNAIIQGSAADIMKRKLVELHANRKALNFTMRMTVHDEVTGDVPDVASADRINELLNVQSFDLLVPIRWKTGTGHNWAEAK